MEKHFWINAWNEGRTNFHQQNFHPKLTKYFPHLDPEIGQRVLVPLCGKTKDMVWLHELGLHVHGVELYEAAVQGFFADNHLDFEKGNHEGFIRYSHKNITIDAGDFFKLEGVGSYDLVYDRASLVALPEEMRKQYAQVLTRALKVGGKYLLIVYEYDQTKMEGPPFSVDANEIHRLYEDHFTIKLLESERPINEGARLAVMDSLKQKVYVLEKKAEVN